ncbi:MAG TPA: hypothetical protein VKR58_10790 [Aquella sp.]|nr:hypothetical protein [Aquella sp.]
MKNLFLFSGLFLTVCCKQQEQKSHAFSQDLNGKYYAFELNGLRIDTLGNVNYYGKERFPTEKWFYKVSVTINDNLISIEKSPVFFDNKGQINYSASDGGFLSYSGKLIKFGDNYIANTKLYDCDYIGLSPWQEPPKIVRDEIGGVNTNTKESFERPDMSNYDTFVFKDGRTFFLLKGTTRKDFIIRYENKELWINNERFYRTK